MTPNARFVGHLTWYTSLFMSERKTDFFCVMCNFSILPPGRLLAVKNFAQSKNFDPMDILNLHKISFPMVYNMSLSKFFPQMTLF